MAASRYRLSQQALRDLENIADYLGSQNPEASDRVLQTIEETFKLLTLEPQLGVKRDDLHPNIRLFVPRSPADRYAVFYYAIIDGVEISDVIHAARDWVGMFGRQER